ncbi:uncharacterized protein LOC127087226 isoform X1 [Lathyrus oleraceus]|uniref:Myb/SANT-like DNA-binding domain-containing protein n=1 Tax=Pisum sativum TaxID=3888 RepID=A0A9D4X2H6_PEA|nr:uncharacterized protein LOC127087226 isoform X1 [Pisum sativum]KAI5413519.1 hypothetical protein KIW84_057914 [Pisum sativum]
MLLLINRNHYSTGGGFLSGSTGGILDIKSPFHRHQSVTGKHHMNIMTGLESDNKIGLVDVKNLNVVGLNFGKGKAIASSNSNPVNDNDMSEDDEAEDGNCENLFDGGKGKKGSPWQRMKWTDEVVGLLIAVVSCVGDDGTIGGVDGVKRKSVVLQKKGKWKTVSKIMISKGCHVSPQQCEDKFNDLNKRYKRLNEILGRGTCCQVVENPALMDSMTNLSGKAKDDVRKILSSKHLFYKEMCAYHNGQRVPSSHDLDLHGYSLEHGKDSRDNDGSEDEDEDNNESEDDELDDEININAHGDGGRRMDEFFHDRDKLSEEDGHSWPGSIRMKKLEVEMAKVFQDPAKSPWERREWIKAQLLELQEQNAEYQAKALELQKQRFKWLRYCSKKDREMEKMKMENKRMRLENDRRILKLKQREQEADFSRSEMSLDPTTIGINTINTPQGREHVNLARQQ